MEILTVISLIAVTSLIYVVIDIKTKLKDLESRIQLLEIFAGAEKDNEKLAAYMDENGLYIKKRNRK